MVAPRRARNAPLAKANRNKAAKNEAAPRKTPDYNRKNEPGRGKNDYEKPRGAAQ